VLSTHRIFSLFKSVTSTYIRVSTTNLRDSNQLFGHISTTCSLPSKCHHALSRHPHVHLFCHASVPCIMRHRYKSWNVWTTNSTLAYSPLIALHIKPMSTYMRSKHHLLFPQFVPSAGGPSVWHFSLPIFTCQVNTISIRTKVTRIRRSIIITT
jgi:hypothetical protein